MRARVNCAQFSALEKTPASYLQLQYSVSHFYRSDQQSFFVITFYPEPKKKLLIYLEFWISKFYVAWLQSIVSSLWIHSISMEFEQSAAQLFGILRPIARAQQQYVIHTHVYRYHHCFFLSTEHSFYVKYAHCSNCTTTMIFELQHYSCRNKALIQSTIDHQIYAPTLGSFGFQQ